MAKGPCPVCKAPVTIAKGQTAVKCGACETVFRVVRQEGRVRLRRAKPKGKSKRKSKKASAKQQSSNRTFLISFGILALIFIASIVVVVLLLLSQSGGM